jgi:hypothetical protein
LHSDRLSAIGCQLSAIGYRLSVGKTISADSRKLIALTAFSREVADAIGYTRAIVKLLNVCIH